MQDPKSDTFKVFIRCRPLNEKESVYGDRRKSVSVIDPCAISLTDMDGRESTFTYDHVFGETSHTQQIFSQAIQPAIDHFINGFNSTVFAYGITGAGKSFTMFGSYQQHGLIPLTINNIFESLQNESCQLKISYIEIYNEQIFDLLVGRSDNLQVIQDPDKGVIVMDLEERPVRCFEQAHQYINEGNARRVITQTQANDYSSRSHAIVLLTLERQMNDRVVTAKMSLVDLAGSQKGSVYTGQNKDANRLEGSNINKSLLALGNCINILSEGSKKGGFVPYRDSKLTRLLKDSLGGNTKTVMIACVSQSPLCYQETLSTLKYAGRARKIQKVVHQNTRQSIAGSSDYIRQQLQRLRTQNQMLKMSQVRDALERKYLVPKVQGLLNKLVEAVRHTNQLEIQGQSESQIKKSQIQRQLIIEHIINTVVGAEPSLDASTPLFHGPKKQQSKDNQRSKSTAKGSEMQNKLKLQSLSHVRTHRRRTSIAQDQTLSNTLAFLNNYKPLQQNKNFESLKFSKSQSTLLHKENHPARRSKHLNILKQIQEMSKKLKVISRFKSVNHQDSIQEGAEYQRTLEDYQ